MVNYWVKKCVENILYLFIFLLSKSVWKNLIIQAFDPKGLFGDNFILKTLLEHVFLQNKSAEIKFYLLQK